MLWESHEFLAPHVVELLLLFPFRSWIRCLLCVYHGLHAGPVEGQVPSWKIRGGVLSCWLEDTGSVAIVMHAIP